MTEYISIAVSTTGILVALVLYYADLRRMVRALLDRNVGVLTAPQARDRSDLYLESVRKQLLIALIEFFRATYPDLLKTKNTAGADHFAITATKTAVSAARAKVSQFRLKGGQSFRDFLDSESPLEGVIAVAKNEAAQLLRGVIKAGDKDTGKLTSQILIVVDNASGQTLENLKHEIGLRYATD